MRCFLGPIFVRRLWVFLAATALVVVGCGGPSAVTPTASSAATKLPFDYTANLITPGTLEAATTGNVPGQTLINASGVPEGYRIDFCNAIANRLGLKVHYVIVDFASMLSGITLGRYDMTCTGVTVTPERQASTDFLLLNGDIRNATSAVARADDARFKGSLQDGKGLVMGGTQGAVQITQVQQYLNNDVKVVTYPGTPEMRLDLKNKRIDFYVDNLIASQYVVKSDPTLKLVDANGIVPTLNADVVSKREPELHKAVNAAVLEMLTNGSLAALQQKWYGASLVPPAPSPKP
jgi:ABC-type amino acid transport substrate-binding protein